MAKLVTGRHSKACEGFTNKPTTVYDRIKENTNQDGEVKCIECNAGLLIKEDLPIVVNDDFYEERKPMLLNTFHCNTCKYMVIDKDEAKEIRNYLQKDLAFPF